MKARYILAVFCGMLLTDVFLSAQTEEFRFKLYMESLSTGKRDTLEFGVGPNGLVGCDYDSALCPVYTEPFFDTVDHIGAFIVPKLDYSSAYSMCGMDLPPLRVACHIYAKKRIAAKGIEIPIVFPSSEEPVKVSWNNEELQAGIEGNSFLIRRGPFLRYNDLSNCFYPESRLNMYDNSSCIVQYAEPPTDEFIKLLSYIHIQDTDGQERLYQFFNIVLDERTDVASDKFERNKESLKLYPNPMHDMFFWTSSTPLSEWRVYSLSGRLVRKGTGNDYRVDCLEWAPGVYLFVGYDGNGIRHSVKFIKE